MNPELIVVSAFCGVSFIAILYDWISDAFMTQRGGVPAVYGRVALGCVGVGWVVVAVAFASGFQNGERGLWNLFVGIVLWCVLASFAMIGWFVSRKRRERPVLRTVASALIALPTALLLLAATF